jgi:hypothetical protein
MSPESGNPNDSAMASNDLNSNDRESGGEAENFCEPSNDPL